MKTPACLGFFALLALALGGCAPSNSAVESEADVFVGMPNPWVWVETLGEAEARAGFRLGAPEVVAGTCRAVRYGVLTTTPPMLEVVYQMGENEITLRKEPGTRKDISGVYGFTRKSTFVRSGVTITCARPPASASNPDAWVLTFSSNGYAFSLYSAHALSPPTLNALLSPLLPQ